jgi:hypothetical protein
MRLVTSGAMTYRDVEPEPRLPAAVVSADLFRQGDDDACGAAEVAEPEDVLVLSDLAEELGAVVRRRAMVSSMSSTANMMRCRPSVLGRGFCGSGSDAGGVW